MLRCLFVLTKVGCEVPLDPGISAATIEHQHVVVETEEQFTGKEYWLSVVL